MTDLYEILQVSPNADTKRIAAAYRSLAKDYHPDLNKDPDATAEFRRIKEAYEILSDPDKRREYDQRRSQPPGQQNPPVTPRTKTKQAFWARHITLLTNLMLEWKDKYFGGMAAVHHNESSIMIPLIDSPEMTFPNITCRGTGEHIGIWCEKKEDLFVVAIFSLPASYVACREMVLAEDLEGALIECALEMNAIRGGYR